MKIISYILIAIMLIGVVAAAPSLTLINPVNDEYIKGTYTIEWLGDSDPFTASYFNAVWINICAVISNNDCDWDTTAVLDGTYQVKVADTLSQKVYANVTIDNTNPVGNVISPNGGEEYSSSVSISFTATDDNYDYTELYYSDNSGGDWIYITDVTSSPYVWDVSALADGSNYQVRIVNHDLADNTNIDDSDSDFTIDNTAPTISITGPSGVWATTDDITADADDVLTGLDATSLLFKEIADSVDCDEAGMLVGTSIYLDNIAETFDTVDHTGYVCFQASDNVGNTVYKVSDILKVDNTNPTVSVGSDETKGALFTKTSTSNDDLSGIVTYLWTQEAEPLGGVLTFGDANSDSTSITADTDGTYTIRLTVTDAVGNIAFDEFDLVWDHNVPTVTLNTPADDTWQTSINQIMNFYSNILGYIGTYTCILNVDGSEDETLLTVANNVDTDFASNTLSQGTHTWSVDCERNDNGLTASSGLYTTKIDSVNPFLSLSTPDTTINSNFDVTFNLADATSGLKDDATCIVEVRENLGAWGEWDDLSEITDSDLSYTEVKTYVAGNDGDIIDFRLNCNDVAGNSGTQQLLSVEYQTDISNTFAVTLNKYDVWSNETITVQAEVSNTTQLENVIVNIQGNEIMMTSTGNNIYRTTIDLSALSLDAGNQTQLYVYGKDVFGNTEVKDVDNTMTFTLRSSEGESYINMQTVISLIEQYFKGLRTVIGNIYATIVYVDSADNTLQNNIDSEETARINSDDTLQDNIDTESDSRSDADDVLQNNIDSEATTRSVNDVTLQTNINTESNLRIANDTLLDTRISVLELDPVTKLYVDSLNNVMDVRVDVLEADPVTKTYVDSADGVLQDNITAETNLRVINDNALDGRLDTLESDPVTKTYVDSADSVLQTNINAKQDILLGNEAVFNNWDKDVSDDFDGAYSSLTGLPDLSVFSTIVYVDSADSVLQTNINAKQDILVGNEAVFNNWDKDASDDFDGAYSSLTGLPDLSVYSSIVYVDNADDTLQDNIDIESNTRSDADTVLQNNIDSEATTRSANDVTLQNNINIEITNRGNGDNTLQTQIDNLGSTIEYDGVYVRLVEGWNQLRLPSFVLEGTAYTDGMDVADYNVTTVLNSIAGNYDYIAYYTGSTWKVFVPGNAVASSFTVFPTGPATPDYVFHIHMTTTDDLVLDAD